MICSASARWGSAAKRWPAFGSVSHFARILSRGIGQCRVRNFQQAVAAISDSAGCCGINSAPLSKSAICFSTPPPGGNSSRVLCNRIWPYLRDDSAIGAAVSAGGIQADSQWPNRFDAAEPRRRRSGCWPRGRMISAIRDLAIDFAMPEIRLTRHHRSCRNSPGPRPNINSCISMAGISATNLSSTRCAKPSAG